MTHTRRRFFLHDDGELTLAPGRDIVPAERLTTSRLYFPLGVEPKVGDVLKVTTVDSIVQQCNCLALKAHGLSQAIADRYPWADPYRIRRHERKRNLAVREDRAVPGSIKIMKNSNGDTPDVIVFYAQWDLGTGRVKRIPTHEDTPAQREKWLKECLEALGALPDYQN